MFVARADPCPERFFRQSPVFLHGDRTIAVTAWSFDSHVQLSDTMTDSSAFVKCLSHTYLFPRTCLEWKELGGHESNWFRLGYGSVDMFLGPAQTVT